MSMDGGGEGRDGRNTHFHVRMGDSGSMPQRPRARCNQAYYAIKPTSAPSWAGRGAGIARFRCDTLKSSHLTTLLGASLTARWGVCSPPS